MPCWPALRPAVAGKRIISSDEDRMKQIHTFRMGGVSAVDMPSFRRENLSYVRLTTLNPAQIKERILICTCAVGHFGLNCVILMRNTWHYQNNSLLLKPEF